ncbi:MAG TPA: hypothetical protein VN031_02645 [Candidatus Microsaccharimonas sp.]|nr:hypothetical protein [Candidatus Microsaccharimonas sp.]
MSEYDAIEIEDYYAERYDAARRKGFIGRMERKLHNKERRGPRS